MQFSIITDAIRETPFAVVLVDGDITTFHGVHEQGRSWAEETSKKSADSGEWNIPDGTISTKLTLMSDNISEIFFDAFEYRDAPFSISESKVDKLSKIHNANFNFSERVKTLPIEGKKKVEIIKSQIRKFKGSGKSRAVDYKANAFVSGRKKDKRKGKKKIRVDWETLRRAPVIGLNGSNPGITSGPSQFIKPVEVGQTGYSGTTVSGGGTLNMFGGTGSKMAYVGPEYVRDNDPDVFTDPESARFRSRQLGCVGISKRVSKTGKTVYMPCTNMSDYSRVSGGTSLGRRHQQEQTRNVVRTIVSQELKKRK